MFYKIILKTRPPIAHARFFRLPLGYNPVSENARLTGFLEQYFDSSLGFIDIVSKNADAHTGSI